MYDVYQMKLNYKTILSLTTNNTNHDKPEKDFSYFYEITIGALYIMCPRMMADCNKHGLLCIEHQYVTGRTMSLQYKKNAIFWDVTPCGPCKNRRFGGT
jgi:hypothetical protein